MTTVAYLVNQYPKVSHSFIRREILALEAQGLKVQRYSVRPCPDTLVEPADQAELDKTQVLLAVGALGLLLGLLRVAILRGTKFWPALRLAFAIGWRSQRGLCRHLIYLAEASVLLDWLAKTGVEHLHAHFGTNPAAVALLCHALGGPAYSFTVHGPDEFDQPQPLHLRTKVAHAAFVVAVSSFGKSQLYRWSDPADWPKIKIVHCGLDAYFLDPPLIPITQRPQFVCVGRLCAAKGQLLLVEAVAQLVAEGVDLQVTLVGDGEWRSHLEQAIHQAHLQDQITITGWVNTQQLRQHLLGARAMVLPSFAEGLPVVLMEALALGRPVISTYIAGIPELVDPGIQGWLVPAGSVSDLKQALQECLQASPTQLGDMGAAGAERVAIHHNITTEARHLAQLFRQSIIPVESSLVTPE